MRKIKFRIYDKELKESHIEELEDLCEDDYWYDGETEVWSVLKDCNDKQERFVALQYTGLHDKNGKEIYEGDIFEIMDSYEEKFMAYIEYCEKYAQFVVKGGTAYYDNEPLGDLRTESIEIIGNIYENPELLEKE